MLGKANDKCTMLTTEATDERPVDTTTQSQRRVYLQVRKFDILHEVMLLLVPEKIHTLSMVKIKLSLQKFFGQLFSLHAKIFFADGVWIFFATIQYSKVCMYPQNML